MNHANYEHEISPVSWEGLRRRGRYFAHPEEVLCCVGYILESTSHFREKEGPQSTARSKKTADGKHDNVCHVVVTTTELPPLVKSRNLQK
ncbi:hypothetical protein AVEN_190744-1 [Araneus ventricosus]|uniref:Uncharacterized protein n=1 Tax=Araneus ventricosus TaxID=182803 RepID=A0A4Y2QAC8_ARAVE|nr:hypothetical protein AVEN_255815-1 [Araneus ventricosus]GBN60205.1 hypothetical protein AVEN_60432-1 [Araneus ventricosus]GBN60220.1 hypothetical protein AVEN_160222-1 [Araneus ventricosus]GBN60234.1 hypothetical protein AVEN_190744-1 [Araneus ventricosus]